MKYHIECDGTTIASFMNDGDRDICLDALADSYPDAVFRAVDE